MLRQVPTDDKLVRWLESLSCDRLTISKFIAEEYTFSDIMELVSRDDLRRMNLRFVSSILPQSVDLLPIILLSGLIAF